MTLRMESAVTLCRCLACGEIGWDDFYLRRRYCPENADASEPGSPYRYHGPTQDVEYVPAGFATAEGEDS